jgi:hypothetical protein
MTELACIEFIVIVMLLALFRNLSHDVDCWRQEELKRKRSAISDEERYWFLDNEVNR